MLAAHDHNKPPVFKNGASCIELTGPRHIELLHLVFSEATGNGLNIDDGGVDSRSPAKLQIALLQTFQPLVLRESTMQRSSRLGLPVGEVDGRYGQDPQFSNAEQNDLRLVKTTPVRDAGAGAMENTAEH